MSADSVRMDDWELRIELARLDERLKSLTLEVTRTEKYSERALELAKTGLDRHLETIKLYAADMRSAQEKHVRDMLDSAMRDRTELDVRLTKAEEQVAVIENLDADLRGRLWLPMLGMAAIVAGLITVAIRFMFPG